MHFVAPDVGTSAALWAALNDPASVRSLVIGGGAMAVPLEVGGSLKDIIEAPGHGRSTARSTPGTFSVRCTTPCRAAHRPRRFERTIWSLTAGDRFVESARYVRTYPAELPKLAEKLPGIETPVQIVCGRDDPLVPTPNQEFLHARLPHSRMDLLPAGHFAWEEVPDMYGEILVNWVASGYREASTTPTKRERV